MKQGNPTKRFGIIALMSAMIAGFTAKPEGVTHAHLETRKAALLTNGGYGGMRSNAKNQRQKRKAARQMQRKVC